jgi:endonuclease/exonuclease/phosphatase family metal-dependent hydrolase
MRSHHSWFIRATIALFLAFHFAPRLHAEPANLKVMSFNIRFARMGHSEEKTENNWNDPKFPRRERVLRVIRQYDPDILGVQEARNGQIKDLRKSLPEYDFYGVGRDNGKTGGEYTAIYFRKDRLKKIDAGSFWLSSEPEKPGSKFKDAPDALTRIASWVRLIDHPTGNEFVVLNTHWDHLSDTARRHSATLIRERLASVSPKDTPMIVMGDFNSQEDGLATKALLDANGSTPPRLYDTYRKLHPERKKKEATFNGWNGKTAGSRIDFILATEQWKPLQATIDRTSYDGRWPSDHYPITATLKLTN